MWLPYRSWIVLLASAGVLMALFMLFAYVTGWPPVADSCIPKTVMDALKIDPNADIREAFGANECFCEKFNPAALLEWSHGVRQPVNTWFNLYALITSGVVASFMWSDRASGGGGSSVIRSTSWIADLYVFCVLFLGLGSMWFHASMSAVVSWFDGFSMYVYASFLVYFTIDRWLAKRGSDPGLRSKVFWIGYPITVVVFTVIAIIGVPSVILIAALVVAYLVFEIFFAGFNTSRPAWIYFTVGAISMALAIFFWIMSQTGMPFCSPTSGFQPHGLLWHPLAGLMAVMMYFYWRCDGEGAAPSGGGGDGWH